MCSHVHTCCSFPSARDGKGHGAALDHRCAQLADTWMCSQGFVLLTQFPFRCLFSGLFTATVSSGFTPSGPRMWSKRREWEAGRVIDCLHTAELVNTSEKIASKKNIYTYISQSNRKDHYQSGMRPAHRTDFQECQIAARH